MPNKNDVDRYSDSDEEERNWKKLKTEHGTKLEERTAAIRSGPWGITRREARVAVLGTLEYSVAKTAVALGIDIHTVENHRTHIRNKVGIPANERAFDMLFTPTPPPEKK
jgi:DNA-binding CsgD family transcriptional regulator